MKLTLGRTLSMLGVLALAGGIAWRFSIKAEAKERAKPSKAAPAVRVVSPTPAPENVRLTLPGSVRPKEHVVLYARTNGFLRTFRVDLGDQVKKGQVLASIDAPEVTANLIQAKARFAQAKASISLVKAQHERALSLAKEGNLSSQDLDSSALRLAAAESELATSGAEVQRLSALVGFQTVSAPFDGTITRRMVDNGALVSAGSTPLFEVASTSDLRVDVDVPQWLSSHVNVGAPAQVTIGKEMKVYDATVERTAGALDPILRTLSVQLVFRQSAPAQVVPGAYARVTLEAPRMEPALILPGTAVAIRNGGPTVGVVQQDHTLRFVPVKLLRELGREVEIQSELPLGAKVALFPPSSLSDGEAITPVEGKP